MHPERSALLLMGLAVALTACDVSDDSYGEYDDSYYAPPPATPAPSAAAAPPTEDGPTPSGDRFEDYGTNPFVAADEDNLVTFSIDVDTASYTLARRALGEGRLPEPASVRVEEFVNFFDYADAPPRALTPVPFAVHLEAAPSRFGEGLHLLRVGLKGYELAAEDRKGANLVFLVDVSGSMQSSDKIGLVQHALTRLTETLRPDDTIGIVVYAGNDGVALRPTPVRERDVILDAIRGLSAGGSTNGEAGIRAAYRLAEEAFREDGINRVILCSDGDFNVGLTGDALIALIESFRDRGITLSAFGFGSGNYNDRDMEQLADRGNGNYAYIDRADEAERVLVRGATGTLQHIAKDVKIQVELDTTRVLRYRLIGYENRDIADDDFRDDAVDAGEVGAGHEVTAFIEVALRPGAAEMGGDLATVRLRWIDPDLPRGAAAPAHEMVDVLPMGAVRGAFDEASPASRLGAGVAEFAEVLRHSPHVQGDDFDGIAATVRAVGDGLDPSVVELLGLIEEAATLWP